MSVEHDGLRFTRPGHASVRIETDDLVLYVDPWSEVLDGRPEDADAILLTHDDYDHYDPDGVRAVSTPDTTVLAFAGIDASELDGTIERIDVGESVTVGAVTVRAIPAYNLTDGAHVRDGGEPFHAEGDGVGFVLEVDGTTVLVPGDTDFLPEHRDLSAEVVLPPIGGTYTCGFTSTAASSLFLTVIVNVSRSPGLSSTRLCSPSTYSFV